MVILVVFQEQVLAEVAARVPPEAVDADTSFAHIIAHVT